MFEIVGIGACVYDTLIVTEGFPREDTKIPAKEILQSGGGPTSTGLVAAAKLGAKTAFLGVLSDDAGGKFLYNDFIKYGVDTSFTQVKSGFSSFSSYVILNEETKSRTCMFHRGNLPELQIDAAQKEQIAAAKLLMVDGNELPAAIEAAKIAKANGCRVLYDAGGRYRGIEELLPYADYLIPSEEFALGFTGETDAEQAAKQLYTRFAPLAVVITQGKKGGILYDGEGCKGYPAFETKAIDTNGAGDVFHGAYAAATLRGHDLYQSCLFASAASAIKCTKLGARNGAPQIKEVYELLRRNGYEL